MTEAQIGLLFKAAALLQKSENHSHTLLRSYYLMRCKEITKGFGLPEKHFSSKVRCSKCCIEWQNRTEVKTRPLKLSKKQRRRIRFQKKKNVNKNAAKVEIDLLKSNKMEQICTHCNNSTITPVLKPDKIKEAITTMSTNKTVNLKSTNVVKTNSNRNNSQNIKKVENTVTKKVESDKLKKSEINVYSDTKEVFSLNVKGNTISNNQKEVPKIIKNNKRKKDKFAGLCEKAVLASAKLKKLKEKQNKLNLFLKPSS